MDETLKKELFTAIDEAVKGNLEAIVGKEVADKVESTIKTLRLERKFNDNVGLDKETRKSVSADMRAIARNEKAGFFEYSDQAGGYLVPSEVHSEIMRIAETTGIVPRDARKMDASAPELEVPQYTGSVLQGEYIGEDQELDETDLDLGVSRLFRKDWGVIFRLSNNLIADARVDLADWLIGLAGEGLAYRIDREGFMGGTFVGSPFVGLLGSGDVTVQTLGSGKTDFEDFDMAEASTAIGSVKTPALSNAAFYLHRTVWAKLVAKKDATSGIYEFSQDNSALMSFRRANGIQPVGMIQGYPVYTTDVLPANSATAVSTKFGVFGNLNLGLYFADYGPVAVAKSTDATVGGKNLFRAQQTAFRISHKHAVTIGLPASIVVLKTAAS